MQQDPDLLEIRELANNYRRLTLEIARLDEYQKKLDEMPDNPPQEHPPESPLEPPLSES